jgi:hypothetical protein
MASAPLHTRRPGAVTFIGAILYIQAFVAAVAAITLLIWRKDVVDFLNTNGVSFSDGELTATVIGEAISALLFAWVASGILAGKNGFRILVALVQGFNMAVAVYIIVVHHTGGLVYNAVFSLFIGVFVLWALYGHAESDQYFHEQSS